MPFGCTQQTALGCIARSWPLQLQNVAFISSNLTCCVAHLSFSPRVFRCGCFQLLPVLAVPDAPG